MRILVACEAAQGAALMRDARRVGDALAARGHSIVYAMVDPVAFEEYGTSTTSALVAPLLREAPELVLKRRSPSGFDDVLAVAGFANSIQLRALCHTWRQQLELVRPDVIVGFRSPLLWLVGPTLAPTFAVGGADDLPPIIGDGFPRLSASAAPLAADHAMVANANRVLAEFGARPLETLSDVIGRCGQLLYGLPWLDPHLQLRSQKSLGMLAPPLLAGPLPQKKRYAVFLDVFCPNIEALLLGIAGFDEVECELFVGGATSGMTRFLEQHRHIRVTSDFSALLLRVPEMSGVIHHGDADIAETGLAAGVAQLTFPFLPHHQTIIANFEWMGSVTKAPAEDAISKNVDLLNWFSRNASLVVHARHHARQLQATGLTSALPTIVNRIEHGAALHELNSVSAAASSSS